MGHRRGEAPSPAAFSSIYPNRQGEGVFQMRVAVLGMMLMLTCVQSGSAGSDAPAPPPVVGEACARPPTVGRLPRGAELDSVAVEFAPYLVGRRITNRRDAWVVSEPWFEFTHGPERFVPMATMDSLHQVGALSDSVFIPVVGVTYRYIIKARSAEQARSVAIAERPRVVPRPVAALLREMRAKAERDSQPSWY